MSTRDFSADRLEDAEIFAAIQNLVPVNSDGRIILVENDQSSNFKSEEVFRSSYSRMVQKKTKIKLTTLFKMLSLAASARETRGDVIRRLLVPAIRREIISTKDMLDKEKENLIFYSLESWEEECNCQAEELNSFEIKGCYKGSVAKPLICNSSQGSRMQKDLRDAAHSFLRDLFRLNNISGNDDFFYSPDIVAKYWNLIATDPGSLRYEIYPLGKAIAVEFFKSPLCFSFKRSENEDYYQLVEFLALEARKPKIASSRVRLRGLTEKDDFIVQEIMGIETDLFDDHMNIPFAMGISRELSEEGLDALRKDVRRLSGIKASVAFPLLSTKEEDTSAPMLGFSIGLSKDGQRFLLDGSEVDVENIEQIIRIVGRRVFELSRLSYREPSNFPRPDIDRLDEELQQLVDEAEESGLDDRLARNVAIKAAQLDFYESFARLTYSLSEEIIAQLEGSQTVSFTIPRILLAFLDQALEDRSMDAIILDAMEART